MIFILVEGFRNLLRSKFTGFLTIISMIFALQLVSVTGVLFQTSRIHMVAVQNQTTIWVYFPSNIPTEKAAAFEKQFSDISEISHIQFISKSDALRELYPDSPKSKNKNILGFLGYNPLPDAYVLTIKQSGLNTAKINAIQKKIHGFQRGLDIRVKLNQFLKLQKTAITLMKGLAFLAILISIITIILVYNTIRLSIHSKKDVIRTMHLVGARVRFIKSPFIVESLIQSTIAVIIVYFSTTYFIDLLNGNAIINSFLSYPVQMHRFHLHLLASCAFLMSWFGAWISVRKYLKFNH